MRAAREASGIIVELSDDGPGMSHETLASVFDFGLARKDGRIGMRLGLPMSRASVEEMGGTLDISSRVGSGTTVTITLPAAPASASG